MTAELACINDIDFVYMVVSTLFQLQQLFIKQLGVIFIIPFASHIVLLTIAKYE